MTAASLTAHPLREGLGQLLLAALGAWPAEREALVEADPAVGQLRSREPGAWRQLFEREMPAIYRYALSRLGNASDAEDVASAVFEAAWESAEKLEDRGLPPRAWLFGIARNVVGSRRRQLLRQPPQLTLDGFDGEDDAPVMEPELIDLADALQRLSRGHAEVVTLRFVHGLSLAETAAVLNTSVDGVKGRQARALSELRELLRA